ncbi:MAG: O-antigen ligase family protein [Dehalococcoidia bacterium]|nr:O-antigen ligase family protein [Dehalococcoidia bacterium]
MRATDSTDDRAVDGNLRIGVRKSPVSRLRLLLVGLELGLLVAAIPLLLFPRGYLPWIGLGLLVGGWSLHGIATGMWFVRTPVDRPVAILSLMAMVGLYASVDLSLSMPKFYGIVLSIFVFYATVRLVSNERRFWVGIGLLALGVVAVSLIGLVGTDWSAGKFPGLQHVYNLVPRVIKSVQTSVGTSTGFNSNEVGGTLGFLLPLPVALVLRGSCSRLQKVALGTTILLGFGVLALSASRSSLVGITAAIICLLVWRWRRAGFVLVAVVLIGLGVAIKFDAPAIAGFLLKMDSVSATSGLGALSGRPEIWQRAVYMIEDFPFTGIGLNTFPIVIGTLYPLFEIGPDVLVSHAHNIFLQTAVDLGLGGLLGFLGLWVCTAYAGWQAYRSVGSSDRRSLQAALIGLMAGMLSYLIFGLTDAITLGAKPSVLLWLMIGLVIAARRIVRFEDKAVLGTLTLTLSHCGGRGDVLPLPSHCGGRGDVVPLPSHCGGRGDVLPLPSQWERVRVRVPFPSALRRTLSIGLAVAGDTYWLLAYLFVALGFLVVGLGISGWLI